jgi:hypothetical protein
MGPVAPPAAAATAAAATSGASAEALAAAAPGVELREHPVFGRCAFAARAFRPGEILVRERPLVVCSDATFDFDASPAAAAAAGPAALADPAGPWLSKALWDSGPAVRAACDGLATPQELHRACVCYVGYCCAPPAARAAVLTDFLNEVGPEADEAIVVRRARRAAKFIADVLHPRGAAAGVFEDAACDAATAERVLLAFELNAHGVQGNRCVVVTC